MTDVSSDTVITTGGVTSRTLANRFCDLINVLDFGVVIGSNAPDNKPFIDAAIAYATTNNKSVYFPSGVYNTSGSHTISPKMGLLLAGEASFHAESGSTDGFIFSSGNFAQGHKIGGLDSFSSGRALVLEGASLLGLEIGEINGCEWGISIEATSSASCLDNTITFGIIGTCTAGGIRYHSTVSGATYQGNVIKGNFIDSCKKAIYFDIPSGDNNCNLNYFFIAAIDGGGGSSTSGITYNTSGNAPNQTYFDIPSFFGGFTGLWISGGNVCIYRVSIQGSFTYSQFSLLGVGVVVENIYSYANANTSQGGVISASTSSNQASTWNGGVPYPFKQGTFSLAVPAVSMGETVDFYIYHPFTCGYTQMYRVNPRFNQPLIVQTVEDESVIGGIDGHIVMNQVHIRLLAVGTVSQSSQYIDVWYGQ